jgi:hypothetical protein
MTGLAAILAWPAAVMGQPYIAAKLGYGNADFNLGEPYNGVIDDGSFSYGLDVGVGFSERLAVEFGTSGYGNFDGRATSCPPGRLCSQVVIPTEDNDIVTYTLALVPRVALTNVELFGEVGYYRADVETRTRFGSSDFKERGLLLGAGARWYFQEPWSVSVQASRFDDKLYQFTVGAGWGFPARTAP